MYPIINIVYKRNCVYQTAYHVIWCTKYRKPVLIEYIAKEFNKLIDAICEENKLIIISKEIQPDHIHLFISIPPAVSIANAVRKLKGITARKLFIKFSELKKKLYNGALWSPSYYVGTAGNVSAKTIQKYIERAGHIKSRR